MYTEQNISRFLMVQVVGGFLAIGGVLASGVIADRVGRVQTLAATAVAIAVFSGFAPTLLGGGPGAQQLFVLIGFFLSWHTAVGFLIGWPVNSLWLLGLFLAFDLAMQGWALIGFGLALRKA